jgi:UDP-3-O-[3-hydroxymyristoyl] glucosamine N-acyltransferase
MTARGPDQRFFDWSGSVTLSVIAEWIGVTAPAGSCDLIIHSAATLTGAGPGSVTFLGDKRFDAEFRSTEASVCLVKPSDAERLDSGASVLLAVAQPQAAWAIIAEKLHPAKGLTANGDRIDPSAVFEDGVTLEPGCVIGPNVCIGRGTRVGAGAVIGPGCMIGRDCSVGANASVFCALIGDRVKIYAGARIGEAGFGATAGPGGILDMPQLGRVILQDGVTVGANSCIDRGAFDDTTIGENTKLDNLVHVAHNVTVGRNCVMAAYTGISGSCTIGDGVAFGGRAGVADHHSIGSGAQIGAGAAVYKSVPAGETWGGMPAQPMRSWLREVAWLSRAAKGSGRKSN